MFCHIRFTSNLREAATASAKMQLYIINLPVNKVSVLSICAGDLKNMVQVGTQHYILGCSSIEHFLPAQP